MEKLIALISLVLAVYFIAEGNCVAWMAFLLIALVLYFRPPRFLTYSDSNGMYGMNSIPSNPAKGLKVYGKVGKLGDCQDACMNDSECVGFVWDSNNTPSDGWSQYCYGKTESPFTPEAGWYSGVKLT